MITRYYRVACGSVFYNVCATDAQSAIAEASRLHKRFTGHPMSRYDTQVTDITDVRLCESCGQYVTAHTIGCSEAFRSEAG